jgi:predicted permease
MVSTLGLGWNIIGAVAYLGQAYMPIATLEQMSQAERQLFESQPVWVTAAFAVAVWGGTLGCLLLLLFQKKIAKPVLLVSLIGILIQTSHSFFISDAFDIYGAAGLVMPIMVVLIGVLLVFFAGKAISETWLK